VVKPPDPGRQLFAPWQGRRT